MKNILTQPVAEEVIARINNLTEQSQPHWGKMSVDQMFAHCNVPYDMVYNPDKFKKPNGFAKFMIKLFAKKMVTTFSKPYPKNGRTAANFIITDKREFEKEKSLLIDNINITAKNGATYFDGKESHAMGKLTKDEWNVMFYKHIDHHLNQFGV